MSQNIGDMSGKNDNIPPNLELVECGPSQGLLMSSRGEGDCNVCDLPFKLNISPDQDPSQKIESGWEGELRLDQLYPELMMHIFSFLDARFVVGTLTRVCRRFYDLLNNAGFWKARIRKQWPKKYLEVSTDDDVPAWQSVCVHREEQYRLWSNPSQTIDHYSLSDLNLGAIDAIQLLEHGRLLAAGSRDRTLTLFDLNKLVPGDTRSFNTSRLFSKHNAHKGWIWSMSVCDGSLLATGSWDTYVKLWDLTTQQTLQAVKTKSAILCTHYVPESGCLVAGSYNKRVYQLDLRTAGGILSERVYHKGPVLCVAGCDPYLVTASDDSTVCVYDRRADRLIDNTLKMSHYIMSISYDGSTLWLGDKAGQIHLVDASAGQLQLIETYNVGHKGKITGIIHTLGAMFTCSTDAVIKVHDPGRNPDLITDLTLHGGESVSRMSYENNVLAYSGLGVGVYRAKPRDL